MSSRTKPEFYIKEIRKFNAKTWKKISPVFAFPCKELPCSRKLGTNVFPCHLCRVLVSRKVIKRYVFFTTSFNFWRIALSGNACKKNKSKNQKWTFGHNLMAFNGRVTFLSAKKCACVTRKFY